MPGAEMVPQLEPGDQWVNAGRYTVCGVVHDRIYALVYWSEGWPGQASPNDETLHDLLLPLRNMSKMTQKQLAEMIGVEPKTLRRWEHGKEQIRDEYVFALSWLFGVSERFLLLGGAA